MAAINNAYIIWQGTTLVGPSLGDTEDQPGVRHWSIQCPSTVNDDTFRGKTNFTVRWREDGNNYTDNGVNYVGFSQDRRARFAKNY